MDNFYSRRGEIQEKTEQLLEIIEEDLENRPSDYELLWLGAGIYFWWT